MRPVPKQFKISFPFGADYPLELQHLTKDHKHHGVDYNTPKGTPVIFGVDGILNFKGFLRGFGNCVRIKFWTGLLFWKKGYRVTLAHLDQITTDHKIRSKVGKWEQAGLSGASGAYYFDPELGRMRDFFHLHAQLDEYKDGIWQAINPSIAGYT